LTRYRRAGTIPAPLSLPGREPRWSLDAIKEWERTGELEPALTAWGDDGAAQLAAQGAFDGADAKAAARELRKQLGLPLDAQDVAMLAAVLDLTAKCGRLTCDLHATAKCLKHLQTEIRRADAILHPLAAPGTLETANVAICKLREQAAARHTPGAILEDRLPEILEPGINDVERQASIRATLHDLEHEAGLSPEQAKARLDAALRESKHDTK
jgi:hypothetical protein